MPRSPRPSPPLPTTLDEPAASVDDSRPILHIELDMTVPTPRTPPRPLAFDLGLLSPPPDQVVYPAHYDTYSLYTPDDDQPITLSFAPATAPPVQLRPRAISAPPTVETFFDGPASPPDSPPRPRTALLARRSTANLLGAAHRPAISPGGELLPPPPPLFRPTTFWKNTKRSGVTGNSYSPGSYVIRRSTFIAAGLELDRPVADLSAFGVESRTVNLVLPPDSALTISGSHE